MKPLIELTDDLAEGRTTSRQLVEECLEAIENPDGEGARTILKVHTERSRVEADAHDQQRAKGIVRSPIDGLPISLKDLFDETGEVTMAATRLLADSEPAQEDCTVVKRLRRAGAIIIGRSTLTPFAYSGLGINNDYGTPKNPWDRETARIPGGSSSGAAVSITDGMAAAGIGSDTGGSVRIPAALCGVVGFKTTWGRIPLEGIYPLAANLDSVGPLGNTVSCCALLETVMTGSEPRVQPPFAARTLSFAVPQTLVLDDLDDQVAQGFERALSGLSKAGAHIEEVEFLDLAKIPSTILTGGMLAVEAYAFHREQLEKHGEQYDPRIRSRLEAAKDISAPDYLAATKRRVEIIEHANVITAPYDGVLMPTTPIVAPPIAELDADEKLYGKTNLLMLRNTSMGNFLTRCAFSIPCHQPGAAPVGLMVMGETCGDDRLVSVALAVEEALRAK